MNMLKESSPTLIFESCHPEQAALIRQVWAAAYAKGFRDSDRGHEILDEPEFEATEQLRFPVSNTTTRLKNLYAYHFDQLRKIAAEINKSGKQLADIAPVVELYHLKEGARKTALK